MIKVDITDCNIKFGEYIKTARGRINMSQLELANKTGISQSYLSYLESGDRSIDLTLALKLCEAVGMDLRDFINKHL